MEEKKKIDANNIVFVVPKEMVPLIIDSVGQLSINSGWAIYNLLQAQYKAQLEKKVAENEVKDDKGADKDIS